VDYVELGLEDEEPFFIASGEGCRGRRDAPPVSVSTRWRGLSFHLRNNALCPLMSQKTYPELSTALIKPVFAHRCSERPKLKSVSAHFRKDQDS